MSHVRIVCDGPRKQGLVTVYPTGRDAKVVHVNDAGVETDISENVQFVSWSVGTNTETLATVTFAGAAIDAVGSLEIGRVGYEAYGNDAEWKTFDGRDMPRWDDLRPDIKARWEVAAQAIATALAPHAAEAEQS